MVLPKSKKSKIQKEPKTKKGKRILKNRESKIIENPKKTIFIRGKNDTSMVYSLIKDLSKIKTPLSISLLRKNKLNLFIDTKPIEFLCKINDCSLFAVSTHNKKRPHNLILGRCFNHEVLCMFELGINKESFKSISDFTNRKTFANVISVPGIIFQGEVFGDKRMEKLINFFIDFFKGESIKTIDLNSLTRVIIISSLKDNKFSFKHFAVKLSKIRSRVPISESSVNLDEIGPSFEFVLRREYNANEEVQKEANILEIKKNITKNKKKLKNVSTNSFGDKLGKVYVNRQDVKKLNMKRFKGFKKRGMNNKNK